MLETGIDIIEISRVAEAVARYGDRFLTRVFTARELQQSGSRMESLAARFAAKEAAFKALGTRTGWLEVEVDRDPGGKPRLLLYGRAAELADRQQARSWSVSLSHSREYAVAVVVAVD